LAIGYKIYGRDVDMLKLDQGHVEKCLRIRTGFNYLILFCDDCYCYLFHNI